MENGKQPINPQMYTKNGDGENDFIPLNDGDVAFVFAKKMGGLTKREYFAAMAMQGMFANSHATEMTIKHGADVVDRFAIQAVKAADELLKQLEL